MGQSMAEYLIKQGEKRGEIRGEKRGEVRGEKRAKQELLIKLLQSRFDRVPESVSKQISSIRSASRLDGLFEDALNAKSLSELNLESHDR